MIAKKGNPMSYQRLVVRACSTSPIKAITALNNKQEVYPIEVRLDEDNLRLLDA